MFPPLFLNHFLSANNFNYEEDDSALPLQCLLLQYCIMYICLISKCVLLENLNDDAITQLYVKNFSTIPRDLTKLYVTYCRALQQRHQSHAAKSAKTLLTVWLILLGCGAGLRHPVILVPGDGGSQVHVWTRVGRYSTVSRSLTCSQFCQTL